MARDKVFVGWPDGGSVNARFALSMINLHRYELMEPSGQYEVMEPGHDSSIYIQENRNALVRRAKFHGADWLLQIDADESFQPNLLRQIMKTADKITRPIVVGLYANIGRVGENNVEVIDCIYREAPDGQYMTINPPDDMQPFQVDAAGTGIILTHMSVFEKMKYPWFWCDLFQDPNKEEPQFINEDIGFCRYARDNGYEIWCDPLAEAVHWKTVPLSPSTLRKFIKDAWNAKESMVARAEEQAKLKAEANKN